MKKKMVLVLIATMMMSSMTGCGGNKLALADDSFTLELGDSPENHTASYVDVKDEKELKKINFDFSKVDEMTVGDYKATATLSKTSKTFHIEVKDTVAPEASAKTEIKTGVNTPIYAEDMLDSVTELSGNIKVSFKEHDYTGTDPKESTEASAEATEQTTENATEGTEVAEISTENTEKQDNSKKDEKSNKAKKLEIERKAVSYDAAGEYDNVLTLTDDSGNSTDVNVHIMVNNMPVINGATDILAEKGSTIDYMNGVTATDGAGNDITGSITVDSSKVDTNTPGDYEVTYTVTDADGLETKTTVKISIADNIEETANNTDTADGTASEKRVATSSGTGKASDKKNEMNQKHVEEQQAAAEASAQAGNNSSSGSGSSGKKSQSSNSGSTVSSGGNDNSSVSNNGASSSGSTGNDGGSSAPAQQPVSQPSTPSQAPAVCDKGSVTNGALNSTQKAYVDSLVAQWRSSNGNDNTYSDMIIDYLFQQGVITSYGGCEHSKFLEESWEAACADNYRNSGGVYNSMYLSTNGEYENGMLVCYYYQVDIY